jgi:hypothetical protein
MRLSAIALVALMMPVAAAAQGGVIGLYFDIGYTDCNLSETILQQQIVFVVHQFAPEVTASQFRVVKHWGATSAWVDYQGNVKVGEIFTGVSVAYNGCRAAPYLIATMAFISLYETAPCIGLEVVPDPNAPSGDIEAFDCSPAMLYATGGVLCINYPDCCLVQSASSPAATDCYPVSSRESTWGGIKALYR